MKSTQEIANQLVDFCRQGQFEKAVEELYSPKIVSIEPQGAMLTQRAEGMEEFRAKGEAWENSVEEIFGVEVSDPVVAGNFFTLTMGMDVKMKGRPRAQDSEVCVYEVKDGKIVLEQFFYQAEG